MRSYEGQLTAQGFRFGIIVARFNHAITQLLLDGALDCLRRHGADENNIVVTWVPGAFEIPLVANRMAASEQFDALICIGAVIRGATPHFEYVASQVASGVMNAMVNNNIPTLFSVLTTENIEQAQERAGTKAGNLGFNNALAAIEMANLLQTLHQDGI